MLRVIHFLVVTFLAVPNGGRLERPLETIATMLPAKARVLLVAEGLFKEHPRCAIPIEGNWRELVPPLVARIERPERTCVIWRPGPSEKPRDQHATMEAYARRHSFTHILYFQATKKYRWDADRQVYTSQAIDWTLRLHDLGKDEVAIVQGLVTVDEDPGETMPASCPGVAAGGGES